MDDHGPVKAEIMIPELRRELHPMVAAAMAPGAALTPETLAALLAVQRDWEAGEARKAYTRDMAAAKAALPSVIARNKPNPHLKTKYADLATLTNAVTPILASHGFSLEYPTTQDQGQVSVTCRIVHHMGHREEVTLSAALDKGPGRSDVQALGSTVTYLRRYTLMAALGLATADMDDADNQRGTDATEQPDTATNQKRLAWALKAKKKDEAEKYIGKPWQQWLKADWDRLKEWIQPSKPPAVPVAEPDHGQNDGSFAGEGS